MKNISHLAFIFCSLIYNDAQAQPWKEIAKVITAPITAPIEATIDIIEGDDPVDAIIGPWQSAGTVIQYGSEKLQRTYDVFVNYSGDEIEDKFGSDWRRAYETLTALERVQFELATTSGRYLGGCLRGQTCNINQIVAGPLAASLRDAYKIYYPYSIPLPPALVNNISRIMPYEIASRARWVVGQLPEFSVPGFLNSTNEAFGDVHAVTIGNLVIFSRWPDISTRGGMEFLLHELAHFEQYKSFNYTDPFEGIDGFCLEYVRHYKSMESEAKAKAASRIAELDKLK